MPRMSREEKIKQLEQQEAEIKAKKKELLAQQNAEKQKARARRLIEVGVIALKYFGLPETTDPKDFKEYIYSRNCGGKPTDKSP